MVQPLKETHFHVKVSMSNDQTLKEYILTIRYLLQGNLDTCAVVNQLLKKLF